MMAAAADKSTTTKPSPFLARITAIVERVQKLRAVRVFVNYADKRGPILASGLAYQGLFAGFAAIWVSFSIAGIVLSGDLVLRERIIAAIAGVVPGLIESRGGEGAIDPDVLLSAGSFTFAAIIALVGLLFTALGWLDSARASVRTIFDLPNPKTNFLLLKLLDLGVGVAFGIALLVFIGLSIVSTEASGWLLGLVNMRESDLAFVVGRVVTAALMFLLGTVILVALYRFLAGIPIPWSRLSHGVLIGAAGLTLLQLLGTVVITGASANPLIAPFAVIAGLLILFNLGCQVILIGASWIAVDVADRGILLDPEARQRAIDEAREEAERVEARKNPRGIHKLFARLRRRRP